MAPDNKQTGVDWRALCSSCDSRLRPRTAPLLACFVVDANASLASMASRSVLQADSTLVGRHSRFARWPSLPSDLVLYHQETWPEATRMHTPDRPRNCFEDDVSESV
eukprot:5809954-Alexandrium_andersonii.AAC.2